MPLWLIYHTPDILLDNASKQALAKDITAFYTRIGLPAFYAIVNFIPMPTGTLWKGGDVPEKPFVRISIDHIAVHINNTIEAYNKCTERIEETLKPHIADKGYDYEYHIDETERHLWRVNGFIPPSHKSDSEKLWARVNEPVSFEGE
ncbi:hypothetical protein FALBO_16534 [Fusarium albosuccineum]|uniref:Tautomerase cis-CaaD-like domain-containing protein n=1 Tax=Fusarium albosuccineum TaxID=1237068 RepID=A0A8H4KHZ2_9HYPO|nr:hypothetical protein FALBO_16534 [Fusarium albosuccineum]